MKKDNLYNQPLINKKREIVFIADLDSDLDDLVAIAYLQRSGFLKCVVCDSYPKMKYGKQRLTLIQQLGIDIEFNIPKGTEYIFVGGGLNTVSRYLMANKLKGLVITGGFAGCNVTYTQLEEFEGLYVYQSFNFNLNVNATDYVLKSNNVEKILLLGPNITKNDKNTSYLIWKQEPLLKKYNISSWKHMHDLLSVREGLVEFGFILEKPFIRYENLKPYNTGLKGKFTQWGSVKENEDSPYKIAKVGVGWILF